MGGLIPLKDASRRPTRVPVVTALIILVNVFVFVLELMRGDAFVLQWSAIPVQCFRSSLDYDPDRDVHAWQLVAHHRQHDFLMGLRA
jgi:membrane associated rhomboid family serine protease